MTEGQASSAELKDEEDYLYRLRCEQCDSLSRTDICKYDGKEFSCHKCMKSKERGTCRPKYSFVAYNRADQLHRVSTFKAIEYLLENEKCDLQDWMIMRHMKPESERGKLAAKCRSCYLSRIRGPNAPTCEQSSSDPCEACRKLRLNCTLHPAFNKKEGLNYPGWTLTTVGDGKVWVPEEEKQKRQNRTVCSWCDTSNSECIGGRPCTACIRLRRIDSPLRCIAKKKDRANLTWDRLNRVQNWLIHHPGSQAALQQKELLSPDLITALYEPSGIRNKLKRPRADQSSESPKSITDAKRRKEQISDDLNKLRIEQDPRDMEGNREGGAKDNGKGKARAVSPQEMPLTDAMVTSKMDEDGLSDRDAVGDTEDELSDPDADWESE